MAKIGGLGKGMAALLPVVDMQSEGGSYFIAPIEKIHPNRNQPRKQFAPEKLEELAASIAEKGIIQPLVVAQQGDEFEIIAGERRWRAAQKAGLHEIPVVIRDVSQESVMELALIENIQRQDLNAIEEAAAYQTLIDMDKLSQEEVAKRVGKNRSTITNSLRLLKLPENIQHDIVEERLSMGHARALLSLESTDAIEKCRNEIIKKGLSVRATEDLVRKIKVAGHIHGEPKRLQQPDLIISSLEEQLLKKFHSKVSIKKNLKGSGKVELYFSNSDELTRIIDLIDI